ncbi:ulp1 protease c-terminal catalytic domain containing expressed [Hordeum vulgare]|nr:ulp1 protease c-terminal catalytic domain containing expressed [Hordeum vulgare]
MHVCASFYGVADTGNHHHLIIGGDGAPLLVAYALVGYATFVEDIRKIASSYPCPHLNERKTRHGDTSDRWNTDSGSRPALYNLTDFGHLSGKGATTVLALLRNLNIAFIGDGRGNPKASNLNSLPQTSKVSHQFPQGSSVYVLSIEGYMHGCFGAQGTLISIIMLCRALADDQSELSRCIIGDQELQCHLCCAVAWLAAANGLYILVHFMYTRHCNPLPRIFLFAVPDKTWNNGLIGLPPARKSLIRTKKWGNLLDVSKFSATEGLLEWIIDTIDPKLGEFRNPRNNTIILFTAEMVEKSKLIVPEDKFIATKCLHEFNSAYQDGSLKSKDLLYFAIPHKHHWILCRNNLLYKQINIFDSDKKLKNDEVYELSNNLVTNFMTPTAHAKAFTKLYFMKFTCFNPRDYPQQKTRFDGGIFRMLFMKQWDGKNMAYFCKDTYDHRAIITELIITSQLNNQDPSRVLKKK